MRNTDFGNSFNKLKNYLIMDNLFEQITNISKAHAYDIVSAQVKELKEQNDNLKKDIRAIQSEIADMNVSEIANDPSILIQKIRIICSNSQTKNRPL